MTATARPRHPRHPRRRRLSLPHANATITLQRAQLANTESGPEPAETLPLPEADMNGVSFDSASVAAWATEWSELRARRVARAREASFAAAAAAAKSACIDAYRTTSDH